MYTVKGAWACTGRERRIMSQTSAVKTRPRSSAGMCLRMLIETPADLRKVQRTLFLRSCSSRYRKLTWRTAYALEPTEPRPASPTNPDSGILPTASPLRRLARGSCASRFPGLSESIRDPSVQIRLEGERRWQADATYACGEANGGSCPSVASVGGTALRPSPRLNRV
jgi:hypothetical protein